MDASASTQLTRLREHEELQGFRISNVYTDSHGEIVGAKFIHTRTASPVFVLQMETVPKAFIWVDTPDRSDRGVPHALEHLLSGKGTKGRYVTLLTDMRLGETQAGTRRDFNFYTFSSGTGLQDFLEEFRAWLDALFRADFTDTEAERELYHFRIGFNSEKNRTLVEAGSVYDEVQGGQSEATYYFQLNKRLLGADNPFGFDIRGLPEAMRMARSSDIRRFYKEHYHLGPTTGFIFIIDPKEDLGEFLRHVGSNLNTFAEPGGVGVAQPVAEPKYPIAPSPTTSTEIYSFPSGRDSDGGSIRFGWQPVKASSPSDLKRLDIFFRALAADQNSILYRAIIDRQSREFDSGATKLDNDILIQNSPLFPFEQVEISGVPGNRVTEQAIERLREIVLSKIREIANYPDHSPELLAFNSLARSQADRAHRTEQIWAKTPPLFGTDLNTDWKDHLNALEAQRTFTKSLSEEPAWHDIEEDLHSGTNVWRDLIGRFHLLENPTATASKPSSKLLTEIQTGQRERLQKQIQVLRQQYQTDDEQQALVLFEQQETRKTREIDSIQAKVVRPHFTEHPPLTADDRIRYRRFKVGGVPVIASVFQRPPTVDIGVAFDLRRIPRKYYKYLPLLPRCFDSVGLRDRNQAVPYTELLSQIQQTMVSFSTGYEENAFSRRTDLVFRTSVANAQESGRALDLLNRILLFSNCDISNIDRLRDLVAQRLSVDYAFRHDEFRVMQNAAYSFFTQENELFQAAYAAFPRTHWDERLQWKLHAPASAPDIEALEKFARQIYSGPTVALSEQVSDQLKRSDLTAIERELLEYWQRNIPSLPPDDLGKALQELTLQVKQDLEFGPARTIQEIKELQTIVVNRGAVHIDLVIDEKSEPDIKGQLLRFINSIPAVSSDVTEQKGPEAQFPLTKKLKVRSAASEAPGFPWYAALVNPDSVNADMVFYGDLPGYDDLDRSSLIKVLSTKMFAGYGPGSFFIKTREAGLAYAILLTSDPAFKLLWLYADRSPDLPALVTLLSSTAHDLTYSRDALIVDYALRQTFSIPRSIYPPSIRGVAIAQDLRDGNDPERVRRFSEAILSLRHDPKLFSELTSAAASSICAILLEDTCKREQQNSHSVFFFVGSQQTLSNLEKRLSAPKLLRIFPSDYWLE